MFNLDKFIADSVTFRQMSMFALDIEANKEALTREIKGKKVCVIGGAGSIGSSFIASWTRGGIEVYCGYQNGYIYPQGEMFAQYEDYMGRPQSAGYIVADGISNNVTKYKITKQGYDFAKTLLNNSQQ